MKEIDVVKNNYQQKEGKLMLKSYGLKLDRYWLEEVIAKRLSSKGIGVLVFYGTETTVLFSNMDTDSVNKAMKEILFVDTYSTEIIEPPKENTVRTLLGMPNGMELPFPIVKNDRVSVKFNSKQLKSMLEDELSLSVSEVLLEDYYECRDGDISDIHVLLNQMDIKPDELLKLTKNTKSEISARIDMFGTVYVATNSDLEEIFTDEFKVFGDWNAFFQRGSIESFCDEILICSTGIIEKDTSLQVWNKVFPETDWKKEYYWHEMFGEDEVKGFCSIYEIDFKDYKTIIRISTDSVKPFMQKKMGKEFETICLAEGKALLYQPLELY